MKDWFEELDTSPTIVGNVARAFQGLKEQDRRIWNCSQAYGIGARTEQRLSVELCVDAQVLMIPSPRSTFPRRGGPIARARNARSTPTTRSLSTRPARYAFIHPCRSHGNQLGPPSDPSSTFSNCQPDTRAEKHVYRHPQSRRVNAVTIASSLDMVDRRNRCSTRKPRQRRRWCCGWSARSASTRRSWR